VEVGDLLKVFVGVNENFIFTAVKGPLAMAGDSVDLDGIQDVDAARGANILPAERHVWKAAHVVAKNWWRPFGCDYVLDAIRTRLRKVINDILFCLFLLDCYNYFVALSGIERKKVLMVEEVLTNTPFGDHHKIDVDIEVAKIVSNNLAASEGRDATKTVAGATHDDAEEE
jgi:hypothetical protein